MAGKPRKARAERARLAWELVFVLVSFVLGVVGALASQAVWASLSAPDAGALLVSIEPRGNDEPATAVCEVDQLARWEGSRQASPAGECRWESLPAGTVDVSVWGPPSGAPVLYSTPTSNPPSGPPPPALPEGELFREYWGSVKLQVPGSYDFTRRTPVIDGWGYLAGDAPTMQVVVFNPASEATGRVTCAWGVGGGGSWNVTEPVPLPPGQTTVECPMGREACGATYFAWFVQVRQETWLLTDSGTDRQAAPVYACG